MKGIISGSGRTERRGRVVVNNRMPLLLHPEFLAQFDIVFVQYETFLRDYQVYVAERRQLRRQPRFPSMTSPLFQLQWWRIVFDEMQLVESNMEALARCNTLDCVNMWCVIGTPFNRNLQDLFGVDATAPPPLLRRPRHVDQVYRCSGCWERRRVESNEGGLLLRATHPPVAHFRLLLVHHVRRPATSLAKPHSAAASRHPPHSPVGSRGRFLFPLFHVEHTLPEGSRSLHGDAEAVPGQAQAEEQSAVHGESSPQGGPLHHLGVR